jgi:hypothetical protein
MARHDERKTSLQDELGVSRRDLLRRGAIVGGTVLWVTPVIQSMRTPAFAQVTPVRNCFAIKWSPGDGCEDAQPISGGGTVFCIRPSGDLQAGGCGGVSFTSNTNWTATLPSGCTLVQGCSKCAQDCNCDAAQVGNTVTFHPCGVHEISHIELVYCCDDAV